MEIYQKLERIQKQLKAPKNQHNKFGGYNYRSCEDILEAVKPLLDGCVVTISDTIREVGGRIYVEAEATISDGVNQINVTAFAREPEDRKGMDASQITGAASSYARKYALNGLFLIDDTKDADATNDHQPKTAKLEPKKESKPLDVQKVLTALKNATSEAQLTMYFEKAMGMATPEQQEVIRFTYDNIRATGEINGE